MDPKRACCPRCLSNTPDPVDLDWIAHYIKSGKCKKIVFLTGAGMSVTAGIPDFVCFLLVLCLPEQRSAGGLYDTLKPELLTASDSEKGRKCTD